MLRGMLALGTLLVAGCASADGTSPPPGSPLPLPDGAPPPGDAASPPPPSDGSLPPADGPAAAQGLHVEGNHLVDHGVTVRLLGVNHSGTEYTCVQNNGIFEGPSDTTLAAAMKTWKANAVRVPLNEDCWLGINGVNAQYSGAPYRTALATYVGMLRSQGLYVILDLHWNGPGTTVAMHQQPMADADHAVDFWTSVATTFKAQDGVVFDLYNEPYVDTSNAQTSDAWQCWLSGCTITGGDATPPTWTSAGMQALVDAVRAAGAPNVIMVGGLAYANDLSGWLAHEPNDPSHNLAASFHEYSFNTCKDATCWDGVIGKVAAQVPVVTGELGENDCAHGFIDGYMPWADTHGVSYLGWTWNVWDCSNGPALVIDYAGTATAFGAGFKAHLATVVP
jgi:hypothetical protein